VTTALGRLTAIALTVVGAAAWAAPEPASPTGGGPSPREMAGAPVGVHLSWVRGDGAAGCPDAGFIEAQVAARLGDAPFRRPPTQFVEALVTRPAQTLLVAIAMRGADGALLGSRTLTSAADDCRSVANAAALTIAILIDPDALRWINYYAQWNDMVQIPVLALPTPLRELSHGVYCDEFAEFQFKDMMARQFLGAGMRAVGDGNGDAGIL